MPFKHFKLMLCKEDGGVLKCIDKRLLLLSHTLRSMSILYYKEGGCSTIKPYI